MKFITFLACIMMSLSIWSVTSNANSTTSTTVAPEPNGQPALAAGGTDGATYTGDPNCKECQQSFAQSHGCTTGYQSPQCRKFFDKTTDGAPTKANGTVQ